MPVYQIFHSYPLTLSQQQTLATAITTLHCTAFTTPSIFVHVSFFLQTSPNVHFLAGKPRPSGANRIVGIVRTSASRPKSAFDNLAQQIEDAWHEAVKGDDKPDLEKKLLLVTFTTMVTIREAGFTIPEAGHEGGWLREQLPFIKSKRMSEGEEGEDYRDMLVELETREDLKRLMEA